MRLRNPSAYGSPLYSFSVVGVDELNATFEAIGETFANAQARLDRSENGCHYCGNPSPAEKCRYCGTECKR